MRTITALVGFMGAGKTVVGQLLAARLGLPFVDLDQQIAKHEHRPVSELLRELGEARFRRLESKILDEVLGQDTGVLATGGGTVLSPENRRRLRERAAVVWLDLRLEDVLARLTPTERQERPLAADRGLEELIALFESRRRYYAAAAHLRIETSGEIPSRVARNVEDALERMEMDPAGGAR